MIYEEIQVAIEHGTAMDATSGELIFMMQTEDLLKALLRVQKSMQPKQGSAGNGTENSK